MDDAQWEHIRELAHQRYCSISDVMRVALAEYISRNPVNEDGADAVRMVPNTEWYEEHRVPLHDGLMPIDCAFCNEQLAIRERIGKF